MSRGPHFFEEKLWDGLSLARIYTSVINSDITNCWYLWDWWVKFDHHWVWTAPGHHWTNTDRYRPETVCPWVPTAGGLSIRELLETKLTLSAQPIHSYRGGGAPPGPRVYLHGESIATSGKVITFFLTGFNHQGPHGSLDIRQRFECCSQTYKFTCFLHGLFSGAFLTTKNSL
jgi:hypothetical protein